MENQGQRDRYGNPIRQPSQPYSQAYNVAGQPFPSSYASQGRAQSQIGGQASGYGTGQAAAQRPGSGYGYNQSLQPYPSPQLQYGGGFGADNPRHGLPYSELMPYYPNPAPASGYDPSYRSQPIQTQPFPDYYPEQSYTAAPPTPSQIQPYPSSYPQRPGRSSNPTPYTPISTGYTPSFEQPGQMQPPPVQPHQQPTDAPRPSDGYRVYVRKLREAYDHIQAVRLAQGGQALLDASEALLTRVDELGMYNEFADTGHNLTDPGLTRDDENQYDQRLKMWKDFNLCWLAFMQKLKDSLEEIVQTGHQPIRPQSIITPSFLDRMGDKLVAWADSIEKWGLVDYETGVWEEEILEGEPDEPTLSM